MEIDRDDVQQPVSPLPDVPEPSNPWTPDWAEAGFKDGLSCGCSCYARVSSRDTLRGSFETTSAHMDAVCSSDSLS